ncbi:MAG: cell division protein FtsZ [Mollicutes bacterium PWAP]|nr:cell division protein FtsZ [Mollicutes bacterium PWAP]
MESNNNSFVKIKVIGVGGGGNNTIHSMVKSGIDGVDYIIANTDEQVLKNSPVEKKIRLGTNIADGLGAGANPEVGRKAAEESKAEIAEALEGADMVIIASGMGGGTGTGATPVIAKIAKESGALTISVVTTPFDFEGTTRYKNASEGLIETKKNVDSLIRVSNDKLLQQYGDVAFGEAFQYADRTLSQTIRTITDLINKVQYINLDFADITTVMKDKGNALIGIGRATGEDRAIKAATHAISSPILEASIKGAKHALINVSGANVTLNEGKAASDTINKFTNGNVQIIFGLTKDDSIGKDIKVSIIATGLTEEDMQKDVKEIDIKEEVSEFVEKEFETDDFSTPETKELLVADPLPQEEKEKIPPETSEEEISEEKPEEIFEEETILFNGTEEIDSEEVEIEETEKQDDDETNEFSWLND